MPGQTKSIQQETLINKFQSHICLSGRLYRMVTGGIFHPNFTLNVNSLLTWKLVNFIWPLGVSFDIV